MPLTSIFVENGSTTSSGLVVVEVDGAEQSRDEFVSMRMAMDEAFDIFDSTDGHACIYQFDSLIEEK